MYVLVPDQFVIIRIYSMSPPIEGKFITTYVIGGQTERTYCFNHMVSLDHNDVNTNVVNAKNY